MVGKPGGHPTIIMVLYIKEKQTIAKAAMMTVMTDLPDGVQVVS
jgi:hypothetical protein